MTLKYRYRQLFDHGKMIPKRWYAMLKDMDQRISAVGGEVMVVKSNVEMTDDGLTAAFGPAAQFKLVGLVKNDEGSYLVVSDTNSYRIAELEAPEIPPTPTYTIAVSVTDGEDPIEGVLVKIGTATGTTGSAGGCNITVEAGSYDVTATKEGYVDFESETQLVVSKDDSYEITMTEVTP